MVKIPSFLCWRSKLKMNNWTIFGIKFTANDGNARFFFFRCQSLNGLELQLFIEFFFFCYLTFQTWWDSYLVFWASRHPAISDPARHVPCSLKSYLRWRLCDEFYWTSSLLLFGRWIITFKSELCSERDTFIWRPQTGLVAGRARVDGASEGKFRPSFGTGHFRVRALVPFAS